jgi:hypothetical protein
MRVDAEIMAALPPATAREQAADASSQAVINDAVLYVSAFVVSASAVFAVALNFDSADLTGVFLLTLAFGFGASWLLRGRETVRQYGLIWTAALTLLAVVWYQQSGMFLGVPVAALIGSDRQLGLAVTLAAFAIIRSFGLVRVEDLLFCVVVGLATFGVLGSKTFEPRFTAAFLVFAFSSAYLAGQSHFIAERQHSRMPPGEDARRAARQRFALLAALFVIAWVVALPLARAAAALIPPYAPGIAPFALPGAGRGGAVTTPGRPVWSDTRSLQVGAGPIQLGRGIVMRVKCDEALYWRAGSLNFYTGESWEARRGGATVIRGGAAGGAPAGRFDLRASVRAARSRNGPGHVVRQQFEVVSLQGDTLFGAMQPVEVTLISGAHGPVTMDGAGSIAAVSARALQTASYEVLSQIDGLVPQDARSVLDANAPGLLEVPFGARRVADFARQAVGRATRPAAKVAAIVAWVQSQATYSLNAPATPAGEDAVTYFLTSSQVGYCDLFASAVALMCRAQGIPARVAVGFAPGTYDAATGAYVVRDEDAHAWVEVYLPRIGWQTVEASPATGAQARAAAEHDWTARLSRYLSAHLLYLLLALAALAWAAVAAKGRWLDHYLAQRRIERALAAQGERGAIVLAYHRLLRAFEQRGLRRRETETPNEYAQRLGRNPLLATLMPAVGAITTRYLAARFGERELSAEQAQGAQAALATVLVGLRRIKGLR